MVPEAEWPRVQEEPIVDDSDLEMKSSVLAVSTNPSVNVVQWERHLCWSKLCRLYAWWMRYRFHLRCKAKKISPPQERQTKFLSATNLQEALLALCKQAQIESFQDDYKHL